MLLSQIQLQDQEQMSDNSKNQFHIRHKFLIQSHRFYIHQGKDTQFEQQIGSIC